MKDAITQTGPAYFDATDCNIADLAAICSQTLQPAAVPFATEVQKNIPLYDAAGIAPVLADGTARRNIMAEWAHVLRASSGVIVIRQAYDDATVIDRATEIFNTIIATEKATIIAADHFAAAGSNDRVWNSLQKLCEADPACFAAYHGNIFIDAASEAWLGPNYQMTAQVNLVHPGGAAQQAHRDYHLGFMTADISARYPAHVHDLSPVLTLQGGIAHVDMDIEAGPTKLLPFTQSYRPGYAAWRLPDFRAYFEENYVQLPLCKGDLIFFNPALFHAGGQNRTADVERFVNLLQVSSAMGRSLETVNRGKMCRALFPVLSGAHGLTPAQTAAAIAACAEGYSFPTNLDRDPPVGGLAPITQADLMRQGLSEGWTAAQFDAALSALEDRQKA